MLVSQILKSKADDAVVSIAPDASVAAGAAGGRVRAVLTPRVPASAAGGAKATPPASGASGSGSGSGSSAAPAATQPAAPAAGSGLRPSTTLGGELRK